MGGLDGDVLDWRKCECGGGGQELSGKKKI